MENELKDIAANEVAIVTRGAIGRRFNLFKSDDDKLELAKAVADALNEPIDGEASLIDALRKSGVDEDTQEALVAAARLLKGFEDDLPAELRDSFSLDIAAVTKTRSEPGYEGDSGEVELKKAYDTVCKDYSAEERRTMAANGEALHDGSYPIRDRTDLEKAIHAVGHGAHNSHQVIREHIVRRARALGADDALPDTWAISKGDPTSKEHAMADGLSVPVRKEDGTWDTSGVEDPAARAFYDTVLKSLDDAKSEAGKLAEAVKKTADENADLKGKLEERDLVAKADADFSHVAKSDELVPVLKAAKESLDAEQYAKLEEILKSADAKIETGDLFAELGKSGGNGVITLAPDGDAWAKIEQLAKSVVEKSSDPLTEEQGVARVLKTVEGRKLYADYLAETSGGVR